MIGFLQGRIHSVEGAVLILNVRGVGYELNCSQNTLTEVDGRDVVQLLVHTHVREDSLMLFGFASAAEKQMFLSLIKISGIGPKMAVVILSAAPVEALAKTIDAGDVKGLMKLPKVGKKTAEQMILSLKGKLVLEGDYSGSSSFVARDEIVSALVHLGFRVGDVETVVAGMESSTDLQQGIRNGLSALTGQ